MKDDPYLRWLISAEIDIVKMHKLLKRFESARAVFAYAVKGDFRIDDKLIKCANKLYLEKANIAGNFEFISKDSPKYPKRLKQIEYHPIGLFMKGQLPHNFDTRPVVSIIGSRNNTAYGRRVASDIASALARVGVIVVSGMAKGLDAYAHDAALKEQGETIAVLPSGIDVCYPLENEGLYKRIPSCGALVTEFAPGYRPMRWSFPARNRIISGLSDALVIIEAGEKSGTLTTATHAANQGKDVLCVPGSVQSPQSVGTNRLIKDGAGLVTNYTDVLVHLKVQRHLKDFFDTDKQLFSGKKDDFKPDAEKITLASTQSLVYSCINYEPISIEYIIQKTNLDVATINKTLLDLELSAHIKRLAGNKYARY